MLVDVEVICLCQKAVAELLSPDAVLDAQARDRLAMLLLLLTDLLSHALQNQAA